MGHGIATNFLKNGYEVCVWNRTQGKTSDLISEGAIWANTPREAAERADLIFEVTANDESSREVWLGNNGIISVNFDSRQVFLITCATLSAKWVDELAAQISHSNKSFFDMPMTGGRMGAENGELILLAGGKEEDLNTIKDDLAAIAKEVKYFGGAGSGTRYKLILNMLQAIHIAGLGEALKLAKSSGLDERLVGDALAERPGGTTTNLAWRDYQTEPNPINFSVEWIDKDLRYAKEMADQLSLPLLQRVLEQYDLAIEKGFSQSDWTKINKL